MASQIDLIEIRQGACLVCHTKENLVGLKFRAKVLRFCRGCLFTVGDAIQKLKEQEDAKTNQ